MLNETYQRAGVYSLFFPKRSATRSALEWNNKTKKEVVLCRALVFCSEFLVLSTEQKIEFVFLLFFRVFLIRNIKCCSVPLSSLKKLMIFVFYQHKERCIIQGYLFKSFPKNEQCYFLLFGINVDKCVIEILKHKLTIPGFIKSYLRGVNGPYLQKNRH